MCLHIICFNSINSNSKYVYIYNIQYTYNGIHRETQTRVQHSSKMGHIDPFETYMTRILFAFCYPMLGGAMMLVARKNADGKRWLYNGKHLNIFSSLNAMFFESMSVFECVIRWNSLEITVTQYSWSIWYCVHCTLYRANTNFKYI